MNKEGGKEDSHRKLDISPSHFTDTNSISWHEMVVCQLIFVHPIRGLISELVCPLSVYESK